MPQGGMFVLHGCSKDRTADALEGESNMSDRLTDEQLDKTIASCERAKGGFPVVHESVISALVSELRARRAADTGRRWECWAIVGAADERFRCGENLPWMKTKQEVVGGEVIPCVCVEKVEEAE